MKPWVLLLWVLGVACSRQSASRLAEPNGFEASVPVVDHPSFGSLGSAVLAAAAAHPESSPARALPPLSLTASDGTGLRLVRLQARAVVEGPIAFTELRLAFENPEPRVREGRFRVVLPPEAAVSRLAMKIGDAFQEGEIVERQAARLVYEDYLHQRQDPALLEKSAGNVLEARVFPIPAHDVKEIVIAYSEPVVGRRYRLGLAGLGSIDELEIETRIRRPNGKPEFELRRQSERAYAPRADFELAIAHDVPAAAAPGLLVARVRPPLPSALRELERLTVLIDTSASRALEFAADVERLWALLGALAARNPALDVELVAFDQEPSPIFRGKASAIDAAARRELFARMPLGASNLEAALAYVRARPTPRLLVLGDALATAGATEPAALVSAVRSLAPATRRLDLMLSGGLRDAETARALVTGSLPEDGVVLEASESAARNAERLSRITVSGIALAIPGATFLAPSRLDGVQAGDEIAIVARGPELVPGRRVSVALGARHLGQRLELAPIAATPALVERAVARAEIGELEQRRVRLGDRAAVENAALRQRIVELALHNRLLTAHTSLLVLESEAEYARYGLERSALSDILTVGERGIEVVDRRPPAIAREPLLPRVFEDDADLPLPAEGAGAPPALRSRPRRAFRAPLPEPTEAVEQSGYGYEFSDDPLSDVSREPSAPPPPSAPAPAPMAGAPDFEDARAPASEREEHDFSGPPPHTGRFGDVMSLLHRQRREPALLASLDWVKRSPAQLLSYVALGNALERLGERRLAARAYGSLLDLYPNRADLRRFAAGCLERLGEHGLPLAIDSYRKALRDRPDHLTGYHLLALALLRSEQFAEALLVLERGLREDPRITRSATAAEVLKRDLELVAAAWMRRVPPMRGELLDRLEQHDVPLFDRPSLSFVLTWETDANDVDLHVVDRSGERAFYAEPELESGGKLLEDVQAGYGPELFAIQAPRAAPYRLLIQYYSRGPMGYGLGKVDVLARDRAGAPRIESRPFVVMTDRAYLDLGSVDAVLGGG